MKPASFDYHDPTTLADALDLMARYGEHARPLAGGQSLVPLMNFRLLRPAHIIDLNGVSKLNYVNVEKGKLRIGSMTRQRVLERSPEIVQHWPLLREAAELIGYVQIRNRGTIGGSLAHAFPSAELPVALVTLDGSLRLRAATSERVVHAADFFLSTMTTALQPNELLTEIIIPVLPANCGWSYQEVSRRYGDFALAGAAALVAVDSEGAIAHARLTLTGMTPFPAHAAEQSLLGEKPSESLFKNAAKHATENLEQDSDIHASAEYRRSTCRVLARRALMQAAERAAVLVKGSL
jgi:aerobic carbon-monoxide dehydrogenase medium subunit